MSHILIREIARAASPNRPVMFLAELTKRPRATAKSWLTGHRRPSITVLRMLLHVAECRKLYELVQEFERLIRKRTYQPRSRTGFWIIDPVTGQNKANRLGRPRNVWP
jgi:hypothetical protein